MPQSTTKTALKSLTEWWEDMGVEADSAFMRALTKSPASKGKPPKQASNITRPSSRRAKKSIEDWVQVATESAAGANTLDELKAAIEAYEGSPLKAGANKTAVFDGTQGASVMVIGEGPGGQEDRTGLPFVGKAGQLLDKILAAIELDRKTNCFISNVNYWRPPANRNPDTDELAVCRPFVDRMVELAQPKILIATGGVAAKALLATKTGIMKLRGSEHSFSAGTHECLLVPIFHPAYLLRRPEDKSRTWRDLLLVKQRLEEMG